MRSMKLMLPTLVRRGASALAVAATVACAATSAAKPAKPTKAAKSAEEGPPLIQVTDHHRAMQKNVGVWDVKEEMRVDGKKVAAWSAVETCELIMRGLALKCVKTAGEFEQIQIRTWNADKEKYDGFSIDNVNGANMSSATSAPFGVDETTVITWRQQGQKDKKLKVVTKYHSDDHFVVSTFNVIDGREDPGWKGVYTRRK